MKIKRPLLNPAVKSKEPGPVTDKDGNFVLTHELVPTTVQSISDSFFLLKKNTGSMFENYAGWKSFWFIFSITLIVISFVVFVHNIIFFWNDISPEVPLIFDNLNNTWISVTKEFFVLAVTSIYISYVPIYRLFQQVSARSSYTYIQLMCLILSVINLIFIVGIFQILNLGLN